MQYFLGTVQKQIGVMISIIGLIGVLVYIIDLAMQGETFIEIVTDFSVWLLFASLIPVMISIFIENNIFKYLQIIIIIFTGTMNIFDSYNEVYGPGLFFAAWLLIRHYGFFDKYRNIKYLLFFLYLIVLTQFSAIIHSKGTFDAGSSIVVYTVFIVLFVVIIWRDMVKVQTKLKTENRALKMNYTKIRDQLQTLEEDRVPYNLKAVKISPAEERVIKTLTVYKASNREIAERLNIAESTVKLHLYNIYNKIGVDNRFAIIDLCKYNYI